MSEVAAAMPAAVVAMVVVVGLAATAPSASATPARSATPAAPAHALSASPEGVVVAAGQPMQPPVPPPDPPVPGPGVTLNQVPEQECGIFALGACISDAATGMLTSVITEMVNPALDLLSQTLLQTPVPSTVPRLAELWSISWRLAVALYGLVVLVGGLVVMAYQSVQTRYGVREVAPRLVVGFLAGWLTLPIADMAVQIANALAQATLAEVVDERGGPQSLRHLVQASVTATGQQRGGTWVLLLAVTVIGLVLIAVLCGWVLRVVVTIVLVAAAPLVVMWHALPQTDGVARWWWRALAALLSIQIVQALVLTVGLQMVLPPAGGGAAPVVGMIGARNDQASAYWVTLLVLGVLMWVLAKVPGWAWSQVSLGGGRSLLGTAIKAAVVWKTGNLLRGALTGPRATSSTRAAGPAQSTGPRTGARTGTPGTGAGDPYEAAPEFGGGQLGLPLQGLRTRRRSDRSRGRRAMISTAALGSSEATPRPGPGQLALPLDEGIWPEHRPVLGRDGQWRLPFDLARTPAQRSPRPMPSAHPAPAGAARAGRQLKFPADGLWPEQRPRLGPGGQHRFGFPVERTPRRRPTPPPPAPTAPTVATFGGRQLSIDQYGRETDPFRGNRPRAGGQYPLPLPALPPQRPTRRTPPPAAPAPPPPGPGPGQLRLPISTTPPPPAPAPTPSSPPMPPAQAGPGARTPSKTPKSPKSPPHSPSAPPAGTRMPGLRRPRRPQPPRPEHPTGPGGSEGPGGGQNPNPGQSPNEESS